jgi:hypothetical protein
MEEGMFTIARYEGQDARERASKSDLPTDPGMGNIPRLGEIEVLELEHSGYVSPAIPQFGKWVAYDGRGAVIETRFF